MMMRFFTCAYAVLADLAIAAALVFGFAGLVIGGPGWLVVMAVASVCFVAYANYLMLSGRRFTLIEALAAVLAGGGVPLLAVVLAVLLMVLIGLDLFA